ncbi:Protein H05C05.4 [Aphelenchoides avenae]|nr:Protein H05C05.4 [Aphelenchus avenae]
MLPVLAVTTLFTFLAAYVDATPSVYSCPINPGLLGGIVPGVIPAYANGIGEVCGTGSFLHYWTCCEGYPFECCFQFETWAIVFFSVLLVIMVGACLFALGRAVSTRY